MWQDNIVEDFTLPGLKKKKKKIMWQDNIVFFFIGKSGKIILLNMKYSDFFMKPIV